MPLRPLRVLVGVDRMTARRITSERPISLALLA